jgi:GTP-binding protein HflX
MINGNIGGLKSNQIHALERIARRRLPPDRVIGPELAHFLTGIACEIKRQVGILADRQGMVRNVIVGDEHGLFLPDLSHWPARRGGLRGLRYIHVHLDESPPSRDDLTDLALLRFDLMVVIGMRAEGLPGKIWCSYLLPAKDRLKNTETLTFSDIGRFDLNPREFIPAQEEELVRAASGSETLDSENERALLISVSAASRESQNASLDELEELARTAGVRGIARESQRSAHPHPRYLLGEGKLREVIIQAMQAGA